MPLILCSLALPTPTPSNLAIVLISGIIGRVQVHPYVLQWKDMSQLLSMERVLQRPAAKTQESHQSSWGAHGMLLRLLLLGCLVKDLEKMLLLRSILLFSIFYSFYLSNLDNQVTLSHFSYKRRFRQPIRCSAMLTNKTRSKY